MAGLMTPLDSDKEGSTVVTTAGDSICESCYDAVVDAAMTVGEDYNDPERVVLLARASGGDIFEHDCDAEDDEAIECICGCQRN